MDVDVDGDCDGGGDKRDTIVGEGLYNASRSQQIALYHERDTQLSEPNALNTPSLVTVGPNSGDDIVTMMSGA